jgi:uncharacterized protein (UPF0332 family)
MALLVKADVALGSAKLLLAAGDIDGACNRAYYAMVDAARAALTTTSADEFSSTIKTHGGLIAVFSLQLVKSGQVSPELGRMLNRAEEVRLVADYKGESVEPSDAAEVIANATPIRSCHAGTRWRALEVQYMSDAKLSC